MEVLVAALEKKNPEELVKKMNLQSPAIISNQGTNIADKTYQYSYGEIRYLSMKNRGVGLNRNIGLYTAKEEICVLADDDMTYVNGYDKLIMQAFKENPTADVIIFNLNETESKRFQIKKVMKITQWNYTKFGAARIAFRRESILKKRISFSLLFGGGAPYSAGEDTLFLRDCLSKKLKIIAVPITIASLDDSSISTWFTGYNKKLLMDTGACYSELFGITFMPRVIYFIWKNRNKLKEEQIGFFESWKLIFEGSKNYKI